MTSDQTNNDHEHVLKGLQSADADKVIETIEELRAVGKSSDIPILAEMLHLSQNKEVKSKIISLFANLKEKESVPYIVEAIKNERYTPELRQLISSCWENGLDFTNYLSLFVDLLIEGDFVVALEAFTVITNMSETIDQAKIDAEIQKLDQAMHTTAEEKKVLMLDVIDFLPSIGS